MSTARERSTAREGELAREFLERPADRVARDLLGCWVVSTVGGHRVVGEIVETEAYLGLDDPASHAARRIGRTARNASMFLPAGHWYVYRSYGIHWCLNVVTTTADDPQAVLLRALAPVEGRDAMRKRRGREPLASGPGRLGEALGLDGRLDGLPVDAPILHLTPGRTFSEERVVRGPRIGISRAVEEPLRFWVADHPDVSPPRGRPGAG